MNNIFKIVLIGHILIILLVFIGCSEEGSIITPNNNGGQNITTTISGYVVNENNEPLAGVTVTAHGQTKTTGTSGEFMFTEITVPQNRLYVKAEKNGYYNAAKGEQPRQGTTVIKLTMLAKSVTHTISSQSGGSADLTNGSKVEIQPGSVVKQDGSVYSGTVNMSVEYMDPTDVKFSETVAGGDMAARRTDSSDAILYSYGILKVEMESPSGEKLNVTGSKPSTITTKIPDEMVSSAPATIPLWYFDEDSGVWREEGVATKQGNKYVGTVNHFTDWNCDHPGYITSVTGKVVDCQGEPMPNVVVKIGQITANTNVNGEYRRTVPTGVDFEISVEASQNFGMSGAPISIPALTQNQVYQVPLCQLACYPVLTGNFKDCNGNNIYGTVTMWWDNRVQGIMPTQMGGFSFYTAPDRQVRLKFTSFSGIVIDTTIQTPSSPVVMNLGDLRSCGGTVNCVNSFVINGMGFSNQQFVLQNGFSLGVYSVKDSFTVVSSASMDSVNFSLSFDGKTPGLYEGSSGVIGIHGRHFTGAETLTIRVNEYGNVGEHIVGTFEGTLLTAGGSVQISQGRFCSIRQPDHKQ